VINEGGAPPLIAQVRWLGWAFTIALTALIRYIVPYLTALTSVGRKSHRAPNPTDGSKNQDEPP
jgi:hypothetical protein